MTGIRGPLMLVLARARRRPGRWAIPILAIALTVAFAGAVATEAVIVGDHAARTVLGRSSPVERTARLTWTGPLTPAVMRQASQVLDQPGLGPTTEVLALNPARVGGVIVRPAAIAPLGRWLPRAAADRVGSCRPTDCPTLLAGGGRAPSILTTAGVRIRVVGAATLGSAVPLGYAPASDAQQPVLVTGDVEGLDRLGGLGGIYRTHDWVAPLQVADVHSWTLAGVESRLQHAQSALSGTQGQFELTAPFDALDTARAQASAAPTRLLLVGGGVLVSLLLFVLLSAVGVGQEQQAEIDRLRVAGGRPLHAIVFVVAEAGWTCGLAIVVGYALAVLVAAILAGNAGEPVGPVLTHSLLGPDALLLAVGAWLIATALIAASVLIRSGRVLDILAVAAISTLVVGLVLGSRGTHAWTGLLVPLCCVASGVLLFRVTGRILRTGDRLARRRGGVTARLALISLARAGGPAAAAIAFLAVSTALAGFALSFRATLVRGTADQAANRVPLDALVAPGSNFVAPLKLASLERWRGLARGAVFPVRRTQATYLGGAASVTVPMLGVPATAVSEVHGWRTGDGSAPLPVLAGRLRFGERRRLPGPLVPATARWLGVDARSSGLDLTITADLRDSQGNVRQLPLGIAGPDRRFVQARLPTGGWELEAIQLDESTGVAITNGHQNGENPAAATQSTTHLTLGPVLARDAGRDVVMKQDLAGWRGVGAASSTAAGGAREANVVFQTSGFPGVVRPIQPSDERPLPVLADPATVAAAGPGDRIALTVDNLPVQGRIVGVVRRFPTVAGAGLGVIVADQSALSDALDAQLPGQGRTDELWMTTTRPQALEAALSHGALAQLSSSFRSEIEAGLRHQPLASGVMGTLLVAGAAGASLAVLGMLLVVGGPFRDQGIERDLEAQGMGPSAMRRELRVRLAIASMLGVWPGLLIAVLIDVLAVAVVGGTESGSPQPPLVAVVPWLALAGLGVAITALCLLLGWTATARSFPNHRGRPPAAAMPPPRSYEPLEDLAG
ncbi:MAG: hypothetical protein ACXVVQ_12425 [Solirubrobacteraceae bacterium]